jgi:parvulin-like peptidyl-prolyl isomerase
MSSGLLVTAFGPVVLPAISAPPETPPATAPATANSEYINRPVAFIGHDTVITREELGEFLVLRRGADKVDLLVNRRIIDTACREAGIEVTAAEVEASLADDLKGLGGISRGEFVKQILRRYGKNLVEWKEDVIRPKLMLGKLCRTRVHVTEEDIHDAFEARYGEKIECRIIEWSDRKEADVAYAKLRDNETEFANQAKHQKVGPLAATGGKIKPINRHLASINPAFADRAANDKLEAEAFRLQPGEVSNLLHTPDGYLALKCDRRIPADTTINPSAVRDEIVKEVTERKTLDEIPKAVKELRDKAHPRPVVGATPATHVAFTPGCSQGRVVAYVYDEPVTREDLGEYLITRYGAESLELLVNKRIIEEECKAKGIEIDSGDIEAALLEKVAAYGNDRRAFDKALQDNHTSLEQYKEDVIRPQLQLAKLSAGKVKVTDEDLQKAYAAYYGEKIECRLIMWPKEERKYAMQDYAEIRDKEEAFAEKAANQASGALAAHAGHLMDGKKIRLIGRYTLGNPDLERELFSLKPGEVSKLVETPEGIVVMKCDRRVPPDGSVTLESVRPGLQKEVAERMTQVQMPLVFAELRKAADPRLLLKDPNRPEDLTADVERQLKDAGPQKPKHSGPAAN